MNAKIFIIICLNLFTFHVTMLGENKPKSGDYYFKVGTYDRAIRAYKRELKRDKQNIDLLNNIIDSYLKSSVDKSEALEYTNRLLEINRNSESVFKHAQVLFYLLKFNDAKKEFEWVKLHQEKESELYKDSDKFLQWILNAMAYTSKPDDVEFINLGKSINTNKSELSPFVTRNEEQLIFSSNKRYLSKIGINYYNICNSERENNLWIKSRNFGYYINSEYDEIVAGCSPDGTSLFVFHNRQGSDKLGFSVKNEKGRFSYLKDFGHPIDMKGGEYGAWVSESRDTLFFVSENEKGNTDIYYSIRLPNKEFAEARPIPGNVNTDYDENFPVLSNNGKRLYFSSDNQYSMGGYDLFYSDWNEEKKEWGSPVNLGYPINDVFDNYTISMPRGKRYAYVSAIRPEGYGERDIYKVLFKTETPDNLILRCKTVLKTDTGLIVPNFDLQAEIRDSVSNKVIGIYHLSNDSAKFVMALTPGNYKLMFKDNDIEVYQTRLSVPEMVYSSDPIFKEFVIPKQEDSE